MKTTPHSTFYTKRSRAFAWILTFLLGFNFSAHSQGFVEANLVLYGNVYNTQYPHTFQLFDGKLTMTLVNEANPDNKVVKSTHLGPTGKTGEFSYSIELPQQYLPVQGELDSKLSVGYGTTTYTLESISIDGFEAGAVDGESSIQTSFINRADPIQLDLQVALAQSDLDNDGIPDWWEDANGTDKYTDDAGIDIDGDGITNVNEFNNNTNPIRLNPEKDLDFDGLTNEHEELLGSSPILPTLVMHEGWNLIATPHVAEEGKTFSDQLGSTFDEAGGVWTFENGNYVQVAADSALEPGKGYQIYCPESTHVDLAAAGEGDGSVGLIDGWNLVGLIRGGNLPSPELDKAKVQVLTADGVLELVESNNLKPMMGYWIQSDGAQEVILP